MMREGLGGNQNLIGSHTQLSTPHLLIKKTSCNWRKAINAITKLVLSVFVLAVAIGVSTFKNAETRLAESERTLASIQEGVKREQQSKAEQQKKAKPAPKKKQDKPKTDVEATAKKPVAPTQAPTPPAPTYAVGCEHYRQLVSKYSWNVEVAMAVMSAESGCNPMAANTTDNHIVCTGSFGLFQISCHSGQVYDPAQNIAIAWAKYSARGWQPWGVCTSGKVFCH
jgi:hypothetical protein